MFFPAVNKGGDNLINKKYKYINPKNIEKITKYNFASRVYVKGITSPTEVLFLLTSGNDLLARKFAPVVK